MWNALVCTHCADASATLRTSRYDKPDTYALHGEGQSHLTFGINIINIGTLVFTTARLIVANIAMHMTNGNSNSGTDNCAKPFKNKRRCLGH